VALIGPAKESPVHRQTEPMTQFKSFWERSPLSGFRPVHILGAETSYKELARQTGLDEKALHR
jgi:hypothetical protein